jgi:hypothetical protein
MEKMSKRKHRMYLSTTLHGGPQWDEFCRVKVLLHVRHRDLQELTENGTIEWSTLYDHFLEEINADPIDLLGSPTESEIIEEEEEEDELIEDEEQDEFRPDWMILTEMEPKPKFDRSSDLGSRDIDRNHDWINDPRQQYSDTDLLKLDTFVIRDSKNAEKESLIVDYKTLNENQKTVFN